MHSEFPARKGPIVTGRKSGLRSSAKRMLNCCRRHSASMSASEWNLKNLAKADLIGTLWCRLNTDAANSWQGFDARHLGNMAAQLLFDAHHHGHDGAGTSAANSTQPDAGHAVGDIHHFESSAIHVQGRADLLGQYLRDAKLEILHESSPATKV